MTAINANDAARMVTLSRSLCTISRKRWVSKVVSLCTTLLVLPERTTVAIYWSCKEEPHERCHQDPPPARHHERRARPAGAGRARRGILQGRRPRHRVRHDAGHGAVDHLALRQVR